MFTASSIDRGFVLRAAMALALFVPSLVVLPGFQDEIRYPLETVWDVLNAAGLFCLCWIAVYELMSILAPATRRRTPDWSPEILFRPWGLYRKLILLIGIGQYILYAILEDGAPAVRFFTVAASALLLLYCWALPFYYRRNITRLDAFYRASGRYRDGPMALYWARSAELLVSLEFAHAVIPIYIVGFVAKHHFQDSSYYLFVLAWSLYLLFSAGWYRFGLADRYRTTWYDASTGTDENDTRE